MAATQTNNEYLRRIASTSPALVGGKVPVDATITVNSLTVSEVKLLDNGGVNHAAIDSSGRLATTVATSALPTGAATSAKQDTGNTSLASIDGKITAINTGAVVLAAGANSVGAVTQGGTWTVQPGNTANTTAWKVDGSAATQPVSGTFWQATQPVSGTFWQATQPVSGTVTTIPTANSRTLTGSTVSSDGTVASGAFSAQFVFSSDFVGVIAGVTFTGANDRAYETPPLPSGQTYGTITYTISAGSMRRFVVT